MPKVELARACEAAARASRPGASFQASPGRGPVESLDGPARAQGKSGTRVQRHRHGCVVDVPRPHQGDDPVRVEVTPLLDEERMASGGGCGQSWSSSGSCAEGMSSPRRGAGSRRSVWEHAPRPSRTTVWTAVLVGDLPVSVFVMVVGRPRSRRSVSSGLSSWTVSTFPSIPALPPGRLLSRSFSSAFSLSALR